MKNKIRDFILKTIAVIFSILFAIVLFNTIFFNKTIGINYKIPVIIIFTIIVYGIILFLYYIYTKKEIGEASSCNISPIIISVPSTVDKEPQKQKQRTTF